MGSTGSRKLVCPVCGEPLPPRDQNPTFPFCSETCRIVDLGNWLDERYRIPAREEEDEDGTPVDEH